MNKEKAMKNKPLREYTSRKTTRTQFRQMIKSMGYSNKQFTFFWRTRNAETILDFLNMYKEQLSSDVGYYINRLDWALNRPSEAYDSLEDVLKITRVFLTKNGIFI